LLRSLSPRKGPSEHEHSLSGFKISPVYGARPIHLKSSIQKLCITLIGPFVPILLAFLLKLVRQHEIRPQSRPKYLRAFLVMQP
jgi:hypothetical protein